MRRGIALLLWGLASCGDGGDTPRQDFDSDVDRCRAQLRGIYQGLLDLGEREGGAPTESGVRLLASLIASGVWEDSEQSRLELTCPGSGVPPELRIMPAFDDLEEVTGEFSAYAGRDNEEHPLARFPTAGTEPLVACDNSRGMNHDGAMNVLYADGSIKTFTIEHLRETGVLTADMETIFIGLNSQIEDLRKLTLD